METSKLGRHLEELLGLVTPPIGITFSDAQPDGVQRVSSAAPAGCAYWSRAAAGEVFTTFADDHHGCAVGAWTHGAELGPEQKAQLDELVGTMVGLEYLSMAELPRVPTRAQRLAWATYAPLSKSPGVPDVVLVRSRPRAAMLFAEAAHAAGLRDEASFGLRPACSMIPQMAARDRAATSLGCIGNRVYTGLSDDELWYGAPGSKLGAIVERLETIARANERLEAFHRARL